MVRNRVEVFLLNPGHPEATEYAQFYAGYIAKAQAAADPLAALETQLGETLAFLRPLTAMQQGHRYAEGKWSIKQVLHHLSDAERVFSYRAMRIARNDKIPLPSFDENAYVVAAEADRLEWSTLLSEFESVRQSTLSLLRNSPEAAWTRIGVASGHSISVRALVLIMYGHVAHHLGIVRERYL